MEIKREPDMDNPFQSEVVVKQEVNNNFPNLMLSCKTCSAIFASQSLLELHMFTHNNKSKKPRPYNCRYCSKRYITEKYLTIHLQTHSEVKPYTCEVCQKGYVRRAKLERHLLEVHDIKQQVTENRDAMNKKAHENYCSKCGKEFLNLKLLNAHMRMECGDSDSFQCDLKNVSLIFERDKTPAPEKPRIKQRKISKVYAPTKKNVFRRPKTGFEWQCSQCPKSFMSKSEIRHHIKMHDQVRPFVCTICSKDFPKNLQLKKHMKKHLPTNESDSKSTPNKNTRETTNISENHIGFTNISQNPSDFSGAQVPYIVENIVKQEPVEMLSEKENRVTAFPIAVPNLGNLLHCEICGADFRNKSFLKLHMRTHQKNV